jgi:hypothetical protein
MVSFRASEKIDLSTTKPPAAPTTVNRATGKPRNF